MMKRAMMTAILTVCWIEASSADELAWLDAYNVVWTSQSKNSGESMPVGGGDIGLNVWVENNELMFYIGRAGCRDENGALLKLGRARINISPNPFTAGFKQELKLKEGYVELSGKGKISGTIKVWVEVHRPIIHVEVTTDQPVSIVSTYESWRTKDRVLRDRGGKHGERGMCMVTFSAYPGRITLRKDTVEADDNSVLFYHRIPNKSFLFDFTVKQQKLEAAVDELWNPLENLTWGGMMTGDNLSSAGQSSGKYASTDFKGWSIKSDKPARQQHLKLVLHTDQSKTLDAWKQGLQNLVRDERSTKARENNLAWWRQFWDRSFIVVNPRANEKDAGWKVARNYNLFRYMLASNVHGREPTVFNGGVFTFDPKYVNGQKYTPDYRQWGASYHAQNQRLVYWPMLKSGDYDMMLPIFETYRKGLANARARVRLHWGHAGCCFTEAPGPLMLPGPAMYGFHEGGGRGRPKKLEPGVQVNTAFNYIYQGQLEFAWMMLQYHRFSGLGIKPYLPMIKQSVVFYDEHYQYRRTRRNKPPLSPDGKLIISPSNALEGVPGVTNPAEAVAGLMRVLEELCALPEPLITAEERKQFKAMLARVPKLPVGEKDGKSYMRVAASRGHAHPLSSELYPLFPYDLFGLGKGNLEIMKNTWDFLPGAAKGHVISWSQMPIHAARLGNTEYAKRLIQSKLGNGNKRFPAFFPVGHDWQPDHNWGGSGMVALQEMLMQTLDDSILLLPAWPKDWDADFKLHASRQTTVEGRVRNGKLLELKVTPESRKKDVVVAGAPPAKAAVTAAGHPAEGKIEPFLGEPKFDMQQVFKGERLPNVRNKGVRKKRQ